MLYREGLSARAKWIVCIDLLPLERRKDAVGVRRERRAEASNGDATRRLKNKKKKKKKEKSSSSSCRAVIVVTVARFPLKDANRKGSSGELVAREQRVTRLTV